MNDPIRPSKVLSRLFPNGVVAFEARAAVEHARLYEEEARAIAHAAPKRAAEFRTGRACAHRALAQLGVTPFAVRIGPDREPLWPAGLTGSITHTAGFCGAALARQTSCDSLGIDAERRGAVHLRLWRQISTATELEWLAQLAASDASDSATLLFSAKEAFFKCQFPLTRQWLNFQDVAVSIEQPYFQITPCRALALEGRSPAPWRGRFAIEDRLIVTGLCLSPRDLMATP